MTKLNSIHQLVETLNSSNDHSYSEILSYPKLSSLNWEALANWDQPYTRNCVARTDEYELILLCWNPESETMIHDHGGQKCWVRQVSGTVEEVRYAFDQGALKVKSEENLKPGDTTFMDDGLGVHKIGNWKNSRAMTLHLYATPIDECRCYDEDGNIIETTVLEYDTIHDLSAVELL